MTPALSQQMFEFIEGMARDYEDPACWPLAQDEQIRFVRRVLFQVRKIRGSHDFYKHQMRMAAQKVIKSAD